MAEFAVRTITQEDCALLAAQIQNVTARAFGCAGYDDGVMADLRRQPDPVICVCTARNGDVAGFCYGYVAPAAALADKLSLRPGQIGENADTPVGVLKTIVADPACQGQGIGTKLIPAVEKGLAQKGAVRIVVPAWKAGDRVNLAGTMRKTGYEEALTVDGLWRDDCDSGSFICADRKKRCICSAVFYSKTL